MASPEDRERFMRQALREARRAAEEGNVGVGSVIARGGEIVARGRNLAPVTGDPTAHAETVALRNAASEGVGDMSGCALYTTFEPCPMCAGALMAAGVPTLVMGGRPTPQETAYGDYTLERLLEMARWEDRMEVITGVLVEECRGVRLS